MTTITAAMVKELRERTSAGMMDCKKALQETNGDFEEAIKYLRVKGLASAAKRAGRRTNEGVVGHYIHHDNKTAVLVEVNCETDFVAKTDDFKEFVRQLAIHICASEPMVVKPEDIDENTLNEQKTVFAKQAEESGKPAEIALKMADGRLQKWLKEVSLLEQPFLLDAEKTIEQLRSEIAIKTGENIRIRRFVRFSVSDPDENTTVEENNEE